jgi:TM2 domain-containing membrane protein YozV
MEAVAQEGVHMAASHSTLIKAHRFYRNKIGTGIISMLKEVVTLPIKLLVLCSRNIESGINQQSCSVFQKRNSSSILFYLE